MDKKVKQIEAWAEDALKEAEERHKEIVEDEGESACEYPTEFPEYWQGRKDLAELLLLWIHTGENK